MKRETKKVTKKAAKRPARKRVRRQPDLTLDDVVRAARKEGVEVHVEAVPIEPRTLNVAFPEVWNEEVARAAKVLGVEPLEVITKLMAFLPKHYSNHLRMLEAIVEHESDHGNEKIRLQEEMLAHSRDAELRRVKNLVEEIQRRREIIEPNTAFAERETIVRETSYLNPRHGVGYCKS